MLASPRWPQPVDDESNVSPHETRRRCLLLRCLLLLATMWPRSVLVLVSLVLAITTTTTVVMAGPTWMLPPGQYGLVASPTSRFYDLASPRLLAYVVAVAKCVLATWRS